MTKVTKVKKPVRIKKGKKMDTQAETVFVSKRDLKNSGVVEIRGEQGGTGKLVVFIRNPALADVIEKMAMGNYPTADFDKTYKSCLMPYPSPDAKGRSVSRPAIYAATKNFEAAADFSFSSPPRGVLIANP